MILVSQLVIVETRMILETDYDFQMSQDSAKYISNEKNVFSCKVLSITKE